VNNIDGLKLTPKVKEEGVKKPVWESEVADSRLPGWTVKLESRQHHWSTISNGFDRSKTDESGKVCRTYVPKGIRCIMNWILLTRQSE